MKIDSFKQKLKEAKNVEQLNKTLLSYMHDLGYSAFSFTYYSYHPKSKNKIRYDFSSKKLRQWHEHYLSEDYHCIDTTIDATYQTTLPTFWNIKAQIDNAKTLRERQMRLDSQAFGVEKGVSIPIHGPSNDFAILMISKFKGEKEVVPLENLEHELQNIAHYYYHYVRTHLLKSQPENKAYHFSKREMQCLVLLAQHYSVTDIAKELKITSRTVNFHIQNINKKFGVKSKYQAVAKALELGLLTL